MNTKLLFIINDDEKKLLRVLNKFQLPFNTLVKAKGTASQSMLNFFGLMETDKFICMSIIAEYQELKLMDYLKESIKIEEIGRGIAFTIPLSSSSKYVAETFKRKGDFDKMNSVKKYHLILAIVQEGYAEKAMTVAKKYGANGGTVITGRGVGTKNSFKLFNMTIEPGKDIVMIVCDLESKTKIMEGILEKVGIKTEAKGICLSLPIDSAVGIE